MLAINRGSMSMFSGSIYGLLSSKEYKARAITYSNIGYIQGRALLTTQAIGTWNQPIIMEIAVLESGQ